MTTDCSLGLQWTAGFIHKVRTGRAHSFPYSPIPPPTLKMFCTWSSLKSVPELGQHECSQFALLFLYTTFLSNFVFWILVINASLSSSHTDPTTSWRHGFHENASQEKALIHVMSSAGPGDGVVSSLFPGHCPFLFHKMNKWDQTDDPPASLKHKQIILNAPHLLQKSPTPLLGSPELAPTCLCLSPSMHWSLSPGTCMLR